MPSTAQAQAVVAAITSSLPVGFAPILTHIWLAGSLAKGEHFGADIDLVLEVSREAYERYLRYCKSIYGGIDALASNPAEHVIGVIDADAKLERTWAALLTVGIPFARLNIESPHEDLDIICLPVGFDDPASDNRRDLLEQHPGFAYWLTHNSIEVLQRLYPAP